MKTLTFITLSLFLCITTFFGTVHAQSTMTGTYYFNDFTGAEINDVNCSITSTKAIQQLNNEMIVTADGFSSKGQAVLTIEFANALNMSNNSMLTLEVQARNLVMANGTTSIRIFPRLYDVNGNYTGGDSFDWQFNATLSNAALWVRKQLDMSTYPSAVDFTKIKKLRLNYQTSATVTSGNFVFRKVELGPTGIHTNCNISSLFLTSTSDILITNSATLIVDATATVKSITVAPNATLELSSGNTLTTGTVTLQSDATGTAALLDNTTIAPQAVTATVQQYVVAGRNWYLSIPLASGASSLLNRGTSVVCYDEPSGNWIAPAAGTLNKMRGYVETATTTPLTGSTGTVDFTGVVNTGAQSISLTRTAGKTGFNLVGNPYPSYLDWNAVTKTNVSNTLWYRTKEGSVYKFYTYVANSGAGVGSPATVTNKIPPMQAFWVRVNTEGTGSIAVDNNMRSHNDVAGNILKAPKQSTQQLLRLQVSNGINTDETVLYFNANASDAFDTYDAQKKNNDEPSIPEIFTQVGTEKLVINGMSQVNYNTEIPIGFSTNQTNDFSISVNEMSNFETGTRIFLIDKENNPTVENELTNGTAYTFSAPITTATTGRFSLIFRAPGVATGIDNASNLNVQVFVNAANQIVVASPAVANVAVYNVMGQKLYENSLTSTKTTINKSFGTGVYFVQLSVNGQSEIQKVIIR